MPISTRSRGLATTLLPAAAGLRLEHIDTCDQPIHLRLVTTAPTARCPVCATVAARIHSQYTRTLADLPWAGVAVRIALQVRKFFCPVPTCPRRIFAERLPTVAAPYARRTNRLGDVVRLLAFALGGEAGSRLAERLRMATSPATLLRLIRRTPDAPVAPPRVLGVDDFARRKGHTYGTILVDLERHRPIDLLPDRTAATLTTWLKQHAAIVVISRDRSTEYTRGATDGAPQAVHVADRFHLLANLRESLERLLDRKRADVRGIVLPATTLESPIPLTAHRRPVRRSPVEEAARHARRAARDERHVQIHTLHVQGIPILRIARRLHLSRSTVYRYLRLDAQSAGMRTRHGASKLDPYLPYLYQRWQDGCANASQLWRELCGKGYGGSRKMIAIWVRHQRQAPAPSTPRKYLERPARQTPSGALDPDATPFGAQAQPASSRRLAWFLLRDPGTLTLQEQAILTELHQRCSAIAVAYPLVHEFVRMIRQRDSAAYPAWRAAVMANQIPELASFAAGLDRDHAAVLAALTLEWSNGQTEGQVNRLKMVKRQMYGRANFDLLRKRVLHAA